MINVNLKDFVNTKKTHYRKHFLLSMLIQYPHHSSQSIMKSQTSQALPQNKQFNFLLFSNVNFKIFNKLNINQNLKPIQPKSQKEKRENFTGNGPLKHSISALWSLSVQRFRSSDSDQVLWCLTAPHGMHNLTTLYLFLFLSFDLTLSLLLFLLVLFSTAKWF